MIKAFKSDSKRTAQEKAYRFGMFIKSLAAKKNDGENLAVKFCRENGLDAIKSANEGDNDAGGFLVPEEFIPDFIANLERHGVARRRSQIVPMVREKGTRPIRKGGIAVYYPGEAGAATESVATFGAAGLTAKKGVAMLRYSNELWEDATPEYMGEAMMDDLGIAFAEDEDSKAFYGDGTAAYHNFKGIIPGLLALDSTIANIAGLVVGAGNAYSELTRANFNSVAGRLPRWARVKGDTAWFMNPQFFYEVVCGLYDGAGVMLSTDADGNPIFLGYPVEFVPEMPSTAANSQVCTLFGNMRVGTSLGERRVVDLMVSTHKEFSQGNTLVRSTHRWDFNPHSLGNASAVAADRTPGAIVGLITAAS